MKKNKMVWRKTSSIPLGILFIIRVKGQQQQIDRSGQIRIMHSLFSFLDFILLEKKRKCFFFLSQVTRSSFLIYLYPFNNRHLYPPTYPKRKKSSLQMNIRVNYEIDIYSLLQLRSRIGRFTPPLNGVPVSQTFCTRDLFPRNLVFYSLPLQKK